MSALFDPGDRIALKRHGYVFNDDGDGSTSSEDDCGYFNEPEACFKPPPIDIPLEKIVIIAPPKRRKSRNKNLNSKNKPKKDTGRVINHPVSTISVSTRNFYEVLQEISSDVDGAKNEDTSHSAKETGSPVGIKSRKKRSVSDKSDKKRNITIKPNVHLDEPEAKEPVEDIEDTFQSHSCFDSPEAEKNAEEASLCDSKHNSEEEIKTIRRQTPKTIQQMRNGILDEYKKSPISSDENEISDRIFGNYMCESPEFFDVDILLWSVIGSLHARPTETRTSSWDDISRNNIRRSSLSVELEYESITSSTEETACTAVSAVDVSSSFSIDRIWRDLDYGECLYLTGVLVVAVYILNRFKI